MKTAFRESFHRDLESVRQKKILARIEAVIAEVEAAVHIDEVRNLKKMSGARNAYRIRVGEFRLGVFLDKDTLEFVRCLDRKDLYKYFP